MPLRLHGHAVSNYFNTAHAALIEKGVSFEIVRVGASREEVFLARSPLGKVPFLETQGGSLSETLPILEYLEDVSAGVRLHPADPLLRARGRQIMNIVQLYLDAPLRRLYGGVYASGTNHPETAREVEKQVNVAISGLSRLFVLRPYLLGDQLSYADLFCLYCFDLAGRVTHSVFGWSLLQRIEGLEAWTERMRARASTKVVSEEFLPAFLAYLADRQAVYHPDQGGGIFGGLAWERSRSPR